MNITIADFLSPRDYNQLRLFEEEEWIPLKEKKPRKKKMPQEGGPGHSPHTNRNKQ